MKWYYKILIAVIVVDVLANDEILNGLSTTPREAWFFFNLTEWSWRVLLVWAVAVIGYQVRDSIVNHNKKRSGK